MFIYVGSSTSFCIAKTMFNLEDSYFIWYLNLSALLFLPNKFQAKRNDCSKIIIEDPLKSITIFFSTQNDSNHPVRSRSVIRSDEEFIFNFVEIILEYEKIKKIQSSFKPPSRLFLVTEQWFSNYPLNTPRLEQRVAFKNALFLAFATPPKSSHSIFG